MLHAPKLPTRWNHKLRRPRKNGQLRIEFSGSESESSLSAMAILRE
jgi:hypothetical protein